MYVRSLDFLQVLVEHFGHWGATDVGALGSYTAGIEVTAGVLAVADVDIGDDVYDTAVGLLGQAFVPAAVAGFHVEDGDVEAFGSNDAEAAVGVAQDEDGIGLDLYHELVALVYDVAHGGAKVVTYGIEIYLWICKFKITEEYAVEVVVVVLTCVCKDTIKVLAAFVDYGCKTDDLRTSTDNNQKFEATIILELYVAIVCF